MSFGAHELAPNPGATHSKKRIGRGNSSGQGTYAGKGLKGQKSRSGKPIRTSFEGGQAPLTRKLHRLRGFNNKWKVYYQPVNLGTLERFEAGTDVTPELLKEVGVLRHLREPVKVLSDGELTVKLNVTAHRFSAGARARIEELGGTVNELDPRPTAEEAAEAKAAKSAKKSAKAVAAAAPATETKAETETESAPAPAGDEEN